MTVSILAQIVASGLLMGLIYALIAAGLSLIFGLMDVVNFAHGEFLMLAMYATFGAAALVAVDPLFLVPLVVAALFVVGATVYVAVVRHAMRAKANIGMVQVFATFGLAIVIRGVVQFVASPDYRNLGPSLLAGKTISFEGVYLPLPQLAGGLVSVLAFVGLWLMITRTDFGKALEATREDAGAVALVGIDKNRVFAFGWGLGAALVGLAGAMLALFNNIYPDAGAPFALIAYVTVALGGFGSVFGALAAGVLVGLVEAMTTLILPPSMKAVGIYALYLAVVFVRPRGLFGSI